MEQADNEEEAIAALNRLCDQATAVVPSLGEEECEGDIRVEVGCPQGYVLRTISEEDVAVLESDAECVRKLLGWKLGAVIISAMDKFSSAKVQHACVEALHCIATSLDTTPSDKALLLSSFCDQLDCVECGLSPFHKYVYRRAWEQSDVCDKLLGGVPLLRVSSSSELTFADIDHDTDCALPDFFSAICDFARLGWATELVGSGALNIVTMVVKLLSPHTSTSANTIDFTLVACYNAVHHLLDVRQNGWDTKFFSDATYYETLTTALLDELITEARRTLVKHPISTHGGIQMRSHALCALEAAYQMQANLCQLETSYLCRLEMDGAFADPALRDPRRRPAGAFFDYRNSASESASAPIAGASAAAASASAPVSVGSVACGVSCDATQEDEDDEGEGAVMATAPDDPSDCLLESSN